MVVNANGFPVAHFFADFACDDVGFALVHAQLADFDVQVEYVGYLHGRVQEVADVVGFGFFAPRDFQCPGGSGDCEVFGDFHCFSPEFYVVVELVRINEFYLVSWYT